MSDDHELIRRAEARVGTTLKDKWTIDSLLGVGGMAVVYAATHRNKKRVAIKMLHPALSVDPDIRARFLREGYVANTVGHAGAVMVDDDDVAEDGAAFIVMELLQGETVHSRMERKGGRLPVDEVLSIAGQLCDVLAAAHAKGVVHRDLKPENLFLDRSRQLKVLDFGIARLRESADKSKSGTRTGSLMGTPSFMPPEQARGRWDEVGPWTDQWAVGATMFTLLTGRLVHEAGTANEALALAITQRAPPIATLMPECPAAVATIVDRALAYEKENRYPDVTAMQLAVNNAYATLHEAADAARMPALSLPDATGPHAAVQIALSPAAISKTPSGSAMISANLTTTRGLAASSAITKPKAKLPVVPIVVAGGVMLIALVVVAFAMRSSSPSATATLPSASAQIEQEPPTTAVATPPAQPSAQPSEDESAISVDQLPGAAEKFAKAGNAPPAKPVHPPKAVEEPKPSAKPAPAPTPEVKPDGDPFARRR